MKKILVLLSGFALLSSCENLKKEHVDLLIHNATIYTVDEDFSTAEAIAIRGDSILEIGAEHQLLNKYQSKQTIDARQQFVYPGFIDGHTHFFGYAKGLKSVNLVGTKSWVECLERTKAFAETSSQKWIVGRGWDQNDWENKTFPTNAQLNALFPDTPVMLTRIDGHAAIANDAALSLAGVTPETMIAGGEIVLEAGSLTGVLIDNAVDLLSSKVPRLTNEQWEKALLSAQENCFEKGITSVVDAGLQNHQVELLEKLYADSILKMRVYAMLSDNEKNRSVWLERGPYQDDYLSVTSFKYYCDGALGSRGALLLEPYSDDQKNIGLLLSTEEHFKTQAAIMNEYGFQMNTHCIGDSANRLILNVYANELGSVNDKRWRIEHAQIVHPDDISMFGDYSVIPSVQPTHATSDMYWAEERLGTKRLNYAYSFNTLKKELGLIALGTDFPVEGIDPIRTFYASVFRVDQEGLPAGGFRPAEILDRKDALKGMTIWNAIANFEDDRKGSLIPGKLADLVILNYDLMKASPEDMLQTEVSYTISGGEIVYSRNNE